MATTQRPDSAAARYGSTLGIAAAILGVVGVSCASLDLIPPIGGFVLVVLALGLSLVGFVTSIVGYLATSPGRNREGRSAAVRGLALTAMVLVAILVPASKGRGVPRINDITTDTEDPPAFVAALDANPGRDMSYPAGFAEQQNEGYQDLASLVVGYAPPAAYERVRAALAGMPRMEIIGENRAEGRIEATETSALFHFADDIVVRIRPYAEGGSRVDVRSKSRVGKGDLGVNANRIRTLFARIRAGDPPGD
jgi:uncharacterized protein (DUF1499 family)